MFTGWQCPHWKETSAAGGMIDQPCDFTVTIVEPTWLLTPTTVAYIRQHCESHRCYATHLDALTSTDGTDGYPEGLPSVAHTTDPADAVLAAQPVLTADVDALRQCLDALVALDAYERHRVVAWLAAPQDPGQ